MMGEKKRFKVSGDDLLSAVRKAIDEGNARRIRIIHKGRPLIDIPLTAGVGLGAVAVLGAPTLAAIGAIAALVSEVEIEIEKVDK